MGDMLIVGWRFYHPLNSFGTVKTTEKLSHIRNLHVTKLDIDIPQVSFNLPVKELPTV